MSKLQRITLAMVALSLLTFIAVAANAEGHAGCKNGKFVGSYTTSSSFPDIWGDGTNIAHSYVYQLNLHSDGTATQDFSGFPDIMLSGGTGTPFVGSWTCRKDGKLVVTMITTAYGTTTDAVNHPASVPDAPAIDLFLVLNLRNTYLFTVTDDNTLTRIQARTRRYFAADDPSDPSGGLLRPLNTTQVVYKRLVASDADLLAP